MKSTVVKLLQAALFLALVALAACGGDHRDRNKPTEFFSSALSGVQEVPPNQSAATGTGTVSFEPSTRRMQASVTTTGIVGIAAHIHLGAVGVAGGIIFPLNETIAGSGVWLTDIVITEAQAEILRSGNYYFNVHSAQFPNGEIRGQILATARLFSSALTGTQEVPSNASAATGTGSVSFEASTRRMQASVTTSGIVGIAAHIHLGPAGVAGPIIFPLTEAVAGSGIWSTDIVITDVQAAILRSGNYYFNVHSAAFPNGEIRGQILATATLFSSTLSGAQEVPPTPSAATGTGSVSFEPSTRRMQASVTTNGIVGIAAHIHLGAAGVAGGIIFPLTQTAAGSGIWSTDTVITEAQAAILRSGNYYFNVHSAAFPSGEIRGQILAR